MPASTNTDVHFSKDFKRLYDRTAHDVHRRMSDAELGWHPSRLRCLKAAMTKGDAGLRSSEVTQVEGRGSPHCIFENADGRWTHYVSSNADEDWIKAPINSCILIATRLFAKALSDGYFM